MLQYSVELLANTIPYLGKHVQYGIDDDEKQGEQSLNLSIAEKEDWNNNDRDFSRYNEQLPIVPANINALAVRITDQVTLPSKLNAKFKVRLIN